MLQQAPGRLGAGRSFLGCSLSISARSLPAACGGAEESLRGSAQRQEPGGQEGQPGRGGAVPAAPLGEAPELPSWAGRAPGVTAPPGL